MSPNTDEAWIIETCSCGYYSSTTRRIDLDLVEGFSGCLEVVNDCTYVVYAVNECGEAQSAVCTRSGCDAACNLTLTAEDCELTIQWSWGGDDAISATLNGDPVAESGSITIPFGIDVADEYVLEVRINCCETYLYCRQTPPCLSKYIGLEFEYAGLKPLYTDSYSYSGQPPDSIPYIDSEWEFNVTGIDGLNGVYFLPCGVSHVSTEITPVRTEVYNRIYRKETYGNGDTFTYEREDWKVQDIYLLQRPIFQLPQPYCDSNLFLPARYRLITHRIRIKQNGVVISDDTKVCADDIFQPECGGTNGESWSPIFVLLEAGGNTPFQDACSPGFGVGAFSCEINDPDRIWNCTVNWVGPSDIFVDVENEREGGFDTFTMKLNYVRE